MRILRLEAENVKRLRAIDITPEGDLVVVGGNNGHGKSSTLDAIAYALGGKGEICERPLRDGEKSGKVTLDLGDIVVTRTFTAAGGGSLKVTSKDGASYSSPQAMLDKLVGALSFDPLAFGRMKPAEQAETLRSLLGLDFTVLDADRRRAFEERTAVNREVKTLEGQIAGLAHHADAPAAEVDAAAIVAEIDEINAVNRSNDALRALADEAEVGAYAAAAEVERLQAALDAARERAEEMGAEALAARDKANTLTDRDATAARARLSRVSEDNRKVRDNAQRAAKLAELGRKRAESERLTAQIERIDAEKDDAIAVAPMPLPGLGFGESGITLGGVPLLQAATSERWRAYIAIGLALNPTLRVILVRDASLLDADGLALVAQMAAEKKAQVWLERVGKGAECTVIIEDGAVAEREGA